jgi:hypothetical protein
MCVVNGILCGRGEISMGSVGLGDEVGGGGVISNS